MNIELDPGDDHLVIMRRFKNSCRFGFSSRTYPRALTNSELMKKVKDQEPKYIGGEQAFYKLFTSTQNSAFYFENQDVKKTIELNFDLELENIRVKDNSGKKDFKIVLKPQESCFKILETVDKNKGVSIKTRYSWKVIEPPLTDAELLQKAKQVEP